MLHHRNRLYLLLFIACMTGYIWLYIFSLDVQSNNNFVGGCLIKKLTNIPCPSCGTTRAIFLLLKGEIIDSLIFNPIGLIVFSLMLVLPLWIINDFIFKRSSFYFAYIQFEKSLLKIKNAYAFIFLIMMNWIWNMFKNI